MLDVTDFRFLIIILTVLCNGEPKKTDVLFRFSDCHCSLFNNYSDTDVTYFCFCISHLQFKTQFFPPAQQISKNNYNIFNTDQLNVGGHGISPFLWCISGKHPPTHTHAQMHLNGKRETKDKFHYSW